MSSVRFFGRTRLRRSFWCAVSPRTRTVSGIGGRWLAWQRPKKRNEGKNDGRHVGPGTRRTPEGSWEEQLLGMDRTDQLRSHGRPDGTVSRSNEFLRLVGLPELW